MGTVLPVAESSHLTCSLYKSIKGTVPVIEKSIKSTVPVIALLTILTKYSPPATL